MKTAEPILVSSATPAYAEFREPRRSSMLVDAPAVWTRDGQPIVENGYSSSYQTTEADSGSIISATPLVIWQWQHPDDPWPCGPPNPHTLLQKP